MSPIEKYKKHHDRKAEKIIAKSDYQYRHKGVFAIYRLFNRYYLKSFFGPFFSFVFPVIIYAILGNLMDARILFAGVIAMSAMTSGVMGMPFAIMELKKSVLLKRIGASPVRPSSFTLVILSYYTFVIALSLGWLFIWALIIFRDPSMFGTLKTATGSLGFIYGNILNILMGLSFGFMIATFSRSEMQAQALGLIFYFPFAFLSGQFISMDLIANNDVMNWISRFMPFRYTSMIVIESWLGDVYTPDLPFLGADANQLICESNPFRIRDYAIFYWKDVDFASVAANPNASVGDFFGSNWKRLVIYDKADHICGYVVPYVVILGCSLASIYNFKWSAAR